MNRITRRQEIRINTHTHSFPRDEIRRKQWEIALRRENFKASNSTRICSKHFEPDCFDREKFGGTWLKPDAVPTIFNFPRHLLKETKKRKPPTLRITDSNPPIPSMVASAENRTKRKWFLGDFELKDMKSPLNAQRVLELATQMQIEKSTAIKKLQRENLKLKKRVASLRRIIETSETPVKEADDPTPVEPAIKIKTEPVDDYPEPSTSKDTDHEEFILPDRNSSWSTPDSVVEPQFTLSVASLAFPIKSETPDDEQPKKKQRTNSSETSTFVSDTEIRTDNHVDSSEELAHPSLLNEHGRDEFDDFGGHVAGKLRNLDPISATCAKKDIEDTLVKAENGKYLNQTPNTTPSTSPVRI